MVLFHNLKPYILFYIVLIAIASENFVYACDHCMGRALIDAKLQAVAVVSNASFLSGVECEYGTTQHLYLFSPAFRVRSGAGGSANGR
jgi:hypothetical protein